MLILVQKFNNDSAVFSILVLLKSFLIALVVHVLINIRCVITLCLSISVQSKDEPFSFLQVIKNTIMTGRFKVFITDNFKFKL